MIGLNLLMIKMFQNKKINMKRIQNWILSGIIVILYSCGSNSYRLSVVDSKSLSGKQITLGDQISKHLLTDSLRTESEKNILKPNALLSKLDVMIALAEQVRKSESDSSWASLTSKWEDFRKNNIGPDGIPDLPDSLINSQSTVLTQKWAELNIALLKFSGEVRFGDALEGLFYSSQPILSEKLLKSVIYTRKYDQVFVNIIGSSGMSYTHTTGGTVKLIQQTDYPDGNEMILKSECGDLRFMDVFIRIPSWAVNPSVTHGNVKYVALPGEYCEISRKWENGDEIKVVLKN